MINKLYLLPLLLIVYSCSQDIKPTIVKGDTFISSPGAYNLKKGNLLIKEFKDGSLIYGISDKFNQVQYQQSMFGTFNGNKFWTIYIDKQENIWFYSSDLHKYNLLKYDVKLKSYSIKEITPNTIMPKPFVKELEPNINL